MIWEQVRLFECGKKWAKHFENWKDSKIAILEQSWVISNQSLIEPASTSIIGFLLPLMAPIPTPICFGRVAFCDLEVCPRCRPSQVRYPPLFARMSSIKNILMYRYSCLWGQKDFRRETSSQEDVGIMTHRDCLASPQGESCRIWTSLKWKSTWDSAVPLLLQEGLHRTTPFMAFRDLHQ